jgi:hypothetical protein
MNREQLKTVLELFRTNVLTEDQTIDIIMGNNSYKGRPRGDVDTSNPVKALIVKQLDLKGLNMKEVSLGIVATKPICTILLRRGPQKDCMRMIGKNSPNCWAWQRTSCGGSQPVAFKAEITPRSPNRRGRQTKRAREHGAGGADALPDPPAPRFVIARQ